MKVFVRPSAGFTRQETKVITTEQKKSRQLTGDEEKPDSLIIQKPDALSVTLHPKQSKREAWKRKKSNSIFVNSAPYELHVTFIEVPEFCNPVMIFVPIRFLLMCVFHQCWGRVRLWLVTTAGCRGEAGICGFSRVPLCPSTTKHPMNVTSSGSTTYSGQLSNGFMGDLSALRPFYLRRGSLIALSLRLCVWGCVCLNVSKKKMLIGSNNSAPVSLWVYVCITNTHTYT